jgi:hypothetical protein
MTSERPAAPGGGTPARTWPGVLDELEDQMHEAEQVLARSRADEIAAWGRRFDDWIPPALGPLPEELRERAARLLQQQLAVAERMVERITQSQKQRDVAARMSYGTARPVAAYFDGAL